MQKYYKHHEYKNWELYLKNRLSPRQNTEVFQKTQALIDYLGYPRNAHDKRQGLPSLTSDFQLKLIKKAILLGNSWSFAKLISRTIAAIRRYF